MEDQFLIIKKEDLEVLFTEMLQKVHPNEPDRFVTAETARSILKCGNTTLYHLRTKGEISFVQNEDHRKLIVYDRNSLIAYMERNLKKAF